MRLQVQKILLMALSIYMGSNRPRDQTRVNNKMCSMSEEELLLISAYPVVYVIIQTNEN